MAKIIISNIAAILEAANSSLEQAVSATFILGEESDFAGMNEEWGKWFLEGPSARQEQNFLSIRRE